MSNPINPYNAPAGEGPVLAVPVGPPARPVWITIACVIAIVFGGLGLLNGISGLGMLFVGNMTASGPPPNMANDPQIQAQYEMQRAIEEAAKPYYWIGVTQLIISLFLSAALLYGGVTTLSNSETGRQVLIWAFRIGVIYLLAWGAVFVYQQLQMLPVMQTQMEKMAGSMKNAPPQMAQTMRTFATITFYTVMVISLGIGLCQLVAYTLSANYLASDEIEALFRDQNRPGGFAANAPPVYPPAGPPPSGLPPVRPS